VTVLRIEALAHLGRTAQARTLAERFIAAHPDSRSPIGSRAAPAWRRTDDAGAPGEQ
jgi:hypothetical protein